MKKFKYTINGTKYDVSVEPLSSEQVSVTVNGETYVVDMEKEKEPEQVKPLVKPVAAPAPQPAAASSNNSRVYNDKVVKAPLPGVIIDVKVKVGDVIENGETVVILEAMKMNNNLTAECSGTVVAVNVQPGNSVMEDDVLIEIQ
ncbi:MAG: biotin/lipoyl-containing protein [Prevotella sp.]